MTADELPKSDPLVAARRTSASGGKGASTVKGWIAAMKPPASATAHRKWGASDDGGSDQQERWSSGGSSMIGTPKAGQQGGSMWTPEVAAAMGYGKKGRAGSAFQWWILVLSALLAIGSFIAWCVLVMHARDATQRALDALRVNITWWGTLRSILLATAVIFPVLTIIAVCVSVWRAILANKLNIHAPDAKWRKSSKAFQVANVTSSVLLYLLLLMLIGSIGAHMVWAFSARAAHIGSYYAIKYVDPIWNGTSSVVQASQGLVNNFVGLTQSLPVIGRRLQDTGDFVQEDFLFIGGRRLTASDIEQMPPEVLQAGLAAARSLKQLPGIFNNLGGWLSGAANAINNVPMPRVDTSRLGNLPFLPQLLPNGTNNPLFNTLRDVTDAVQSQLLNPSGCPIYCIDLRSQSWIEDGCLCNLDRVKAAYPHVAQIYQEALPTILTLFLMTIASTWLLLHAASQWARTRSEAKLLNRIPHAAKHALALQKHAAQSTTQQPFGPGGHHPPPPNGGHPVSGGVGGKGMSSDGGVSVGSAGGLVKGKDAGSSSRGVSSTGEPSAPLDGAAAAAAAADVPAKSTPAPRVSV